MWERIVKRKGKWRKLIKKVAKMGTHLLNEEKDETTRGRTKVLMRKLWNRKD